MARTLSLIEIKDDFEPIPTAQELESLENLYQLQELVGQMSEPARAVAESFRQMAEAFAASASSMESALRESDLCRP